MKIYKPQAVNDIGGRKNNEDSVFPTLGTANEESRLYLVCDGVGGQDKGEVASAIICHSFPEYVTNNSFEEKGEDFLKEGLKFSEHRISEYLKVHPESAGMASTLTILYFLQNDQALLGWVGDSRIYHIRNGKVLYQTKDHSLVQSLINMGEITEEEAKNHPQKNIIERAVGGEEPTRIDQHLISDIRENDYFLMCTDGILENLDKPQIKGWFKSNQKVGVIREKILANAQGKTKDNFSMYLIKVSQVDSIPGTRFAASESLSEPPVNEQARSNITSNIKLNKNWLLILATLLVLILLILAVRLSNSKDPEANQVGKKPDGLVEQVNPEETIEDQETETPITSEVAMEPEMISKEPQSVIPADLDSAETLDFIDKADSVYLVVGGELKVLVSKDHSKIKTNGSIRVTSNLKQVVKEGLDRMIIFYQGEKRVDSIDHPTMQNDSSVMSIKVGDYEIQVSLEDLLWKQNETIVSDTIKINRN